MYSHAYNKSVEDGIELTSNELIIADKAPPLDPLRLVVGLRILNSLNLFATPKISIIL